VSFTDCLGPRLSKVGGPKIGAAQRGQKVGDGPPDPIASADLSSQYIIMHALISTDNQHRVAEDRFLVMAAVSPNAIHGSSKDKIERAWKQVLKNEKSKSKAEYMEHQ